MELDAEAFRLLVHFAPDAVLVVAPDGRIVFASAQAERLFGYDRAGFLRMSVDELVPGHARDAHGERRASFARSPHTRPMGSGLHLVGRRRDGSEIPVEISLSPLYTDGGGYVTAIVRDVSARRETERALARSEERYRLLAEGAQDVIYRVTLAPRRVDFMSPSVEAAIGYRPEEFVEDPDLLFRVVHAADHEIMQLQLSDPDALHGPQSLRFVRRDGSVAWHEQRVSVVRASTGDVEAIEVFSRDITERVHIEEEARVLLAESEMQRERERIAADLHDGVMQSIYAVSLNLRALLATLDLPDAAGEQIAAAADEINRSVGDIRRYVMDLRPARFSGDVAESVGDMVRVFRAASGIAAEATVAPALPALPEEVGLALFHIAQEALSNVRRHAQAQAVHVRLVRAPGTVTLEVEDDGRGFASAPGDGAHMGLQNMERRARSIGAGFEISSAPGRGTTVTVSVPVADRGAPTAEEPQSAGEPGRRAR